jgi:hypothetical protein
VDHSAAVGAAERARIHLAAAGGAGTVAILNTINAWEGRRANRKAHQCRACDADANAR